MSSPELLEVIIQPAFIVRVNDYPRRVIAEPVTIGATDNIGKKIEEVIAEGTKMLAQEAGELAASSEEPNA